MAPTIVYDASGQPLAAFGAAGGATIIAQVAKAIIAFLDWEMPVEQAIAAPQLVADRRGVHLEAGTRLVAMTAGLKALGHPVVDAVPLPLKGNAIARDGKMWRAAADPRSDGVGLALSPPARKGRR
jgi:gamma-glutamyltranspeptidase/glutathione hydrolase